MTDLTQHSVANEKIKANSQSVLKLINHVFSWFWSITDDAKDMDTKPFDGIL